MNDFAQMLWLPFPFTLNGVNHVIENCDFDPFVKAGGCGAIFEINNPKNVYVRNIKLSKWVQDAFKSKIPVIACFTIDLGLYQEQFPDFWDKDALFPNDRHLNQLTADLGGIRNKEIHGLILRFINYNDRNGSPLPQTWVSNCISVILYRYRKFIPTVYPYRISEDRIFTMIDDGIKSNYDLSTTINNEDWCAVEKLVLPPTPIWNVGYEKIFSNITKDYHPNITFEKDWMISRYTINKWQLKDFNYGVPGQDAILGSAVMHLIKNDVYKKFVPIYKLHVEPEDPPVPPEPETPPIEPTTFEYEKESIFDVLEKLNNMKSTIDQIYESLKKE